MKQQAIVRLVSARADCTYFVRSRTVMDTVRKVREKRLRDEGAYSLNRKQRERLLALRQGEHRSNRLKG